MTQAKSPETGFEIHTKYKRGEINKYIMNPTIQWKKENLTPGSIACSTNHVFLFLDQSDSVSVPEFLESLEDDPVFDFPNDLPGLGDIELRRAKLSIIHQFGFVESKAKLKLPKDWGGTGLSILKASIGNGASTMREIYAMSLFLQSDKRRLTETDSSIVVYSAKSVYRLPTGIPPHRCKFSPGVFLTLPITEVKMKSAADSSK